LKAKVAIPVSKTEINSHEGSAVLTTQHPYIQKFGTKIHRLVAAAQSVCFACGLKAMESLFVWVQPEDGHRIQSPKHLFYIKDRMVKSVQNCDSYNNIPSVYPLGLP
jgi:cystathionine beta-lyase/cystathionine gamma-synthase